MTSSLESTTWFQPRTELPASLPPSKIFLRRYLWVWPLVATVAVAAVGWQVHEAVELALRTQLSAELATILDADKTALRTWLDAVRRDAAAVVTGPIIRRTSQALVAQGSTTNDPAATLLTSPALAELRDVLRKPLNLLGYDDFILVDRSIRVMASDDDTLIGKSLTGYEREFLDGVWKAGPSVSIPHASRSLLKDVDGEYRAGVPTMLTAAPLLGDDGQPAAVLALRLRPEGAFSQIVQVASSGRSGETYAFDRSGRLLSESRFTQQLKQMGLIPDRPETRSILTLELRDPGADLTRGGRPTRPRQEQPLTYLAVAAANGVNGVNVDGFRDYRGVPVIGAWTWLKEYDFGLATKVDVAEAFRPAAILHFAFRGLVGLLMLGSAVIFLFTVVVARQRSDLQKATLAAKQLGQYTLEEKIGSGGMGIVYRARHAFLRRPTAVKLLDIEKSSSAAVARFEREVQLTSQLNHPNTIAIYDYGHTPEGLFYYAMEYLDGVNLQDLVKRYGPVPEGRVATILAQVCGSLAEAHSVGLVHRDIKPANIVLACRGGIYDFIKVLDFGLVKSVKAEAALALTAVDALTGTPLYLSPEAIEQPDQVDFRTDLYAVGAVGYFLLTGTPVFRGANVIEICMKQVTVRPEPPSHRLGRPIAASLEQIILRCLAKNRDERPASARALANELAACARDYAWTQDDAEAWWRATRAAPSSAPSGPDAGTAGLIATAAVEPTTTD